MEKKYKLILDRKEEKTKKERGIRTRDRLTCDGERDDVTGGRSGRDLTLVPAAVPVGRGFDPQQPVFRVELVNGFEAKVGRVGQPADGQEVRVVVSKP